MSNSEIRVCKRDTAIGEGETIKHLVKGVSYLVSKSIDEERRVTVLFNGDSFQVPDCRFEPYKDQINPDHYKSHPSGVECIEVTRHMNFNVGNAIKYLWRQGLKDSNPSIQDLTKAQWYISDEIAKLEKENADSE